VNFTRPGHGDRVRAGIPIRGEHVRVVPVARVAGRDPEFRRARPGTSFSKANSARWDRNPGRPLILGLGPRVRPEQGGGRYPPKQARYPISEHFAVQRRCDSISFTALEMSLETYQRHRLAAAARIASPALHRAARGYGHRVLSGAESESTGYRHGRQAVMLERRHRSPDSSPRRE